MTPERKEFLHCISDFSSVSHIDEFLAETNEGDDDDPDTVILVNENVRSDEEIEKEI
ncbi:8050_t:CDS:2 [Entrophospora sp. SA101]|nr:8050_t:CDS:2 [Entrophospora sp. SA101]